MTMSSNDLAEGYSTDCLNQNSCTTYNVNENSLGENEDNRNNLNTTSEITINKKGANSNEAHHSNTELNEVEEENGDFTLEIQARTLFLKASELEQNGKICEAINFYRKAIQLVPDIECKIYQYNKTVTETKESGYIKDDPNLNFDETESINVEELNLVLKFEKLLGFNSANGLIFPKEEQKTLHISCLPTEIIIYILRWVVTSDLDLRSLEICSSVCRGLYLCCRDSEIWRIACNRVWDVNHDSLGPYDSWRQMFIQRPRLNYNGCYIGKTIYYRQGENSFQDVANNSLWQLIVYYRFLRFFPDGFVIMLTTSEEPKSVVGQLRTRIPKNSAALIGHYKLQGEKVSLVLSQSDSQVKNNNRFHQRKRETNYETFAQKTNHIDLRIQNYKGRLNHTLIWEKYTMHFTLQSGAKNNVSLDLNDNNRYPPMMFSRVKSYSGESEMPL